MRHRLDPPPLHAAARTLGVAVAEGRASLPDAWAACAALARLPQPGTQAHDISGLQTRLCWSAADAANAHAKAAWQAEDAVRYAVRPLIERRAPKHEVEEAAGAAASDAIDWTKIYAILREEVARSQHLTRWR